jgi:opacity protein-like surface antigen
MCLKSVYTLILAMLLLVATHPSPAQTVPDGHQDDIPFAIGGGLSAFNPDFGNGILLGGTAWIDWSNTHGPWYLHGFGVEAEVADIAIGHSSNQPSNLREGSLGAGVTYTWRHFHDYHPYAKFLRSYSSIDFHIPNVSYDHDTRTANIAGAGIEYRVTRGYWVRADYEYQWWPHLFDRTFTPEGLTVGVMYNFRHRHTQ